MTGRFAPTPGQLRLLRFVAGYQLARNGVSPSFNEMARGLQLASRGQIVRYLEGLEERGWIRRLPRRARAIDLLAPPTLPRAPDGAPLFFVTPKGMDHGRSF